MIKLHLMIKTFANEGEEQDRSFLVKGLKHAILAYLV